MRNFIIILSSLLLFQACGKTTKTTDSYKCLSVDITNLTAPDSIKLLIDSVSGVCFKTSDSLNYMGYFNHLSILDDGYFFSNESKLFRFDANGDCLFTINRNGKGPEEYLTLSSVTLKGDTILIMDGPSQALVEYSLSDGSFIRKRKIEAQGSVMEVIGDNIILFNENNYHSPEITDNIHIYDYFTLELKNKLMPIPEELRNLHYQDGVWFSKNEKDDQLYLSNIFDRTIYQITPTECKALYQLDYGTKHNIPDHYKIGRSALSGGIDANALIGMTHLSKPYNYFISSEYGFFESMIDKCILYDLKNDKLYCYLKDAVPVELTNVVAIKDNCLYATVAPDYLNTAYKEDNYQSLIREKLGNRAENNQEPILIKFYLK